LGWGAPFHRLKKEETTLGKKKTCTSQKKNGPGAQNKAESRIFGGGGRRGGCKKNTEPLKKKNGGHRQNLGPHIEASPHQKKKRSEWFPPKMFRGWGGESGINSRKRGAENPGKDASQREEKHLKQRRVPAVQEKRGGTPVGGKKEKRHRRPGHRHSGCQGRGKRGKKKKKGLAAHNSKSCAGGGDCAGSRHPTRSLGTKRTKKKKKEKGGKTSLLSNGRGRTVWQKKKKKEVIGALRSKKKGKKRTPGVPLGNHDKFSRSVSEFFWGENTACPTDYFLPGGGGRQGKPTVANGEGKKKKKRKLRPQTKRALQSRREDGKPSRLLQRGEKRKGKRRPSSRMERKGGPKRTGGAADLRKTKSKKRLRTGRAAKSRPYKQRRGIFLSKGGGAVKKGGDTCSPMGELHSGEEKRSSAGNAKRTFSIRQKEKGGTPRRKMLSRARKEALCKRPHQRIPQKKKESTHGLPPENPSVGGRGGRQPYTILASTADTTQKKKRRLRPKLKKEGCPWGGGKKKKGTTGRNRRLHSAAPRKGGNRRL